MVRYIHHQASNIRSVATDYFTEAIPLKNVKKEIFIKVLKANIIHIFGISLTVTADQEKVFTGEQVKEFAKTYAFEIIHSTPYYTQANGQAESSNKVLKTIIEKMITENPRVWHEVLSEALWAYGLIGRPNVPALE